MTTDGGTEDTAAETDAETPSDVPGESRGQGSTSAGTDDPRPSAPASGRDEVTLLNASTDSHVPQPRTDSDSKSRRRKKVERPKDVSALFQYAYREAAAGRKLSLARDLSDLSVDPDASQAETDLVRKLAADDPFLSVPQYLLAGIADLELKRNARQRVLDLVLVALVTHKLFEGKVERLVDPQVEPVLTAREISNAARTFSFDTQGEGEVAELRGAKRERLRVNAVTAFELFRVLRDGWTTAQFIDDMCSLVWDVPNQRAPRAVALLATAKNTEALSQLSRHFEIVLRQSTRDLLEAHERTAAQARRAELADASVRSLTANLELEQSQVAELKAQLADIDKHLTAERSRAFVDKTHAADDYEILRTQIIRQLSSQVNLLTDGLHALRNGSIPVAEEFVDRALSKIAREVERLKDLEEGPL